MPARVASTSHPPALPRRACLKTQPTSGTPASPPAGMARLAAEAAPAGGRAGVEYFFLPVRSLINRCDSDRVPFRWTINPYRGCEFGCRYCYARYTHEYMEHTPAEFETQIYAKAGADRLLAAELRRLPPGEHIAIGTATDPYQPAEGRLRVTRALLEVLAQRQGLDLSLTTKSNRIERDLDLLVAIAARSRLVINITVTTLDARLARLLEPRAPRPDLRLRALARLRAAGLAAGVFAMPVLPGITDEAAALDRLARAAAEHGALWFTAGPVFLMPASRETFFAFLRRHFPHLLARYRQWFEATGYAPAAYRRALAEKLDELRRRYGLASGPCLPPLPARQLPLAW